MSILYILLVLVIVGVVLFLVTTYVPMPATYKRAVVVIVVVLMCAWVLQITGVLGSLGGGPRIR